MTLYESVFIARQDVTSSQVDSLADGFQKIIEDGGGQVPKREYWGLRSLAYKIKKNRKGHYVLFNIDASSEAMLEYERIMKLNEDILRYMTLRVDELETEPSVVMQGRGRSERSEHGERFEGRRDGAKPTETAEKSKTTSAEVTPSEVQTAEPAKAETAEPAKAETTKPGEAETTKPGEAETTKAGEAETTKAKPEVEAASEEPAKTAAKEAKPKAAKAASAKAEDGDDKKDAKPAKAAKSKSDDKDAKDDTKTKKAAAAKDDKKATPAKKTAVAEKTGDEK